MKETESPNTITTIFILISFTLIFVAMFVPETIPILIASCFITTVLSVITKYWYGLIWFFTGLIWLSILLIRYHS